MIARLRESTRGGDYAYYSDIAAFMAGLPVETASTARWVAGAPAARRRRHALVTARKNRVTTHLGVRSDPPGADAVGRVVPVGVTGVDVAGEIDQRAVRRVHCLARCIHVRRGDRGTVQGVAGREGP